MYMVNCPFNKIKILSKATTGLEKSFWMMYSNLCLKSYETVPLSNDVLFNTIWQGLMYVLHSENLLTLLSDLGYEETENVFKYVPSFLFGQNLQIFFSKILSSAENICIVTAGCFVRWREDITRLQGVCSSDDCIRETT